MNENPYRAPPADEAKSSASPPRPWTRRIIYVALFPIIALFGAAQVTLLVALLTGHALATGPALWRDFFIGCVYLAGLIALWIWLRRGLIR